MVCYRNFYLTTSVCSHSVTQLSNLTMLLGSFLANLVSYVTK